MSKDIECPYCEAWFDICHDDGFGYDEDCLHQYQCPECEKNFVFRTMISYDHFAEKADCLNGAPHQWEEWYKLWTDSWSGKQIQERRCKDCGEKENRTV